MTATIAFIARSRKGRLERPFSLILDGYPLKKRRKIAGFRAKTGLADQPFFIPNQQLNAIVMRSSNP